MRCEEVQSSLVAERDVSLPELQRPHQFDVIIILSRSISVSPQEPTRSRSRNSKGSARPNGKRRQRIKRGQRKNDAFHSREDFRRMGRAQTFIQEWVSRRYHELPADVVSEGGFTPCSQNLIMYHLATKTVWPSSCSSSTYSQRESSSRCLSSVLTFLNCTFR